MALEKMKAMQAGTKNKEKNGKFGKVKLHRKDTNNTTNPDLSNLRKPIDTSISTLYHISKLLEDSTEEIKSILTYECDVIYECRICRSLFRSIVNLISHKREYCREKFNVTLHRNMWDDVNTISAIGSTIDTCQAEQTIIKSNFTNDRILRSQVSKEACKRDLTGVINALIKKQENMRSDSSNKSENENNTTDALSNQHIYLKAIETNSSAVYQTIKSPDTVTDVDTDLAAKEVMELQNTMEQNNTTLELRSEDQSEKSDSPIPADPSDEENKLPSDGTLTSLVCAICNAKFSTKKTLTFHVKTLHTSQRTCYTCPCCPNKFANTWSVHRHLFKVHKKNHVQVRKLRWKIEEIPLNKEAIQDLNINATGIPIAEKIKYNNDLGNGDKAQQGTFHSKSDMEDSSCNRCGKKFDTKAALSVHSQRCQTLIAACDQVATKINRSVSNTSSDSVLNNDTLWKKLMRVEQNDCTAVKPSKTEHDLLMESKMAAIANLRKLKCLLCKRKFTSMTGLRRHMAIHIGWYRFRCKLCDFKCFFKCDCVVHCNKIHNMQNNHAFIAKMVIEVPQDEFRRKENIVTTMMTDVEKKTDDPDDTDMATSSSQSEMREDLSSNDTNTCVAGKNEVIMTGSTTDISTEEYKRNENVVTGVTDVGKKTGDPGDVDKTASSSQSEMCEDLSYSSDTNTCVGKNEEAIVTGSEMDISTEKYKRNENVVTGMTDVEKKTDDLDDANKTTSSFQSKMYEDLSCLSDMTNTCITGKNEETATTDSTSNVSTNNIDGTATLSTNLEEYIENRDLGKLNIHSDLKRMVMEVIFGSADADSATEQTNLEKLLGISNEAERDTYSNDNENSTASTDDTGLTYCSITDGSKSQRPMRKRIKPLSKDFIYDLKDIQFRKESSKSPSSFLLSKSPAKHHLNLCDSETLVNVRKKAKLHHRALNSN